MTPDQTLTLVESTFSNKRSQLRSAQGHLHLFRGFLILPNTKKATSGYHWYKLLLGALKESKDKIMDSPMKEDYSYLKYSTFNATAEQTFSSSTAIKKNKTLKIIGKTLSWKNWLWKHTGRKEKKEVRGCRYSVIYCTVFH